MLRLSLVAAGRGYSLVAAYGLLIAVASLVEQEPWGSQSSAVAAPGLQSTVSVDVVHGFSCSEACGILLEPGIEPLSLALAGGFFTPEPPGKSPLHRPFESSEFSTPTSSYPFKLINDNILKISPAPGMK